MSISIGTVPTGSVVIRKATMADVRDDPSRLVLVQHPDGRYVWLGLTSDGKYSIAEIKAEGEHEQVLTSSCNPLT